MRSASWCRVAASDSSARRETRTDGRRICSISVCPTSAGVIPRSPDRFVMESLCLWSVPERLKRSPKWALATSELNRPRRRDSRAYARPCSTRNFSWRLKLDCRTCGFPDTGPGCGCKTRLRLRGRSPPEPDVDHEFGLELKPCLRGTARRRCLSSRRLSRGDIQSSYWRTLRVPLLACSLMD